MLDESIRICRRRVVRRTILHLGGLTTANIIAGGRWTILCSLTEACRLQTLSAPLLIVNIL